MSERKVKLGVLLPTRGVLLWNDGAPEVGPIIDLAVRAEELGYDSVFVGDSVLAKPRLEALSVLSAVAVKTKRVKLGTAVFLPCLRDPVFLAYQVATLDVISGGRVILGVGIGPPKPQECVHEFETLGVPFRKRMFYMQEHMTLMRRLWTEENVTYLGRYYQVENVTLAHRPIQKTVPMWIASASVDTAWRRVAKYGDGWFPNRVTPEEFRETWGKIVTARRGEWARPGHARVVHDHLHRRRQGISHEKRRGVPARLLLHPLLGRFHREMGNVWPRRRPDRAHQRLYRCGSRAYIPSLYAPGSDGPVGAIHPGGAAAPEFGITRFLSDPAGHPVKEKQGRSPRGGCPTIREPPYQNPAPIN